MLTDFYRSVVKKQGVIERGSRSRQKRIKRIGNNTAGAEWKRFEATVACSRNTARGTASIR